MQVIAVLSMAADLEGLCEIPVAIAPVLHVNSIGKHCRHAGTTCTICATAASLPLSIH